jgi:hypothetical protein
VQRTLSVIFMGYRSAEVDQETIFEILGYVTLILLVDLG